MLAGHIGVAAGAKRWAPQVPIWALLIASFLLDILFLVFWALGIEDIEAIPGLDGRYGTTQFQIDWSHSFFGTMLICLIVLILCTRWWGGKGAFVLSCVVFSHWFLDVIVHRLDLPIAPGDAGVTPRVGLGMWDFPIFVGILELLIVLGGALIWYTMPDSTSATRRAAIITAVAGVAVLVADIMI
ncbi:MAG: hypothetical protein M9909_13435 [Thermomicrobiales bacterium]|nr:hypothetical protein [Thermomicrobiales bacterium]